MTLTRTTIAELRARGRSARNAMPVDDRRIASRRIVDRFLNSRYFFSSRTIGCYVSVRDEVETAAIIERAWRAKKRIFAPVIGTDGRMTFHELLPDTVLARNDFGLWEPLSTQRIDANKLDVVVTPLAAFDRERNRIGMGRAYFDRAFAFLKHRKHWHRPKLIGVAFDCQEVEKIKPNPWDIRLFRVLSEAAPVRFR